MIARKYVLLLLLPAFCLFNLVQADSIVDVSHYSGIIDWQHAKAAGIEMAFIKATEGSSFTDPKFVTNYLGAKQQSLVAIPYHVFSYQSSPQQQLDYLVDLFNRHHIDSKAIAIDFGSDYKKDDYHAATVNAFLVLLRRHHFQPILYVEKNKLFIIKDVHNYKSYPLWLGYSKHFCSFSWQQLDVLRHAHIAYSQYPVNQKVSWASARVDFNQQGDPHHICGKKWLKY